MNVTELKVKPLESGGSTAALKNIRVLHELLMLAIERPYHLPGLVTFSGPSGFGKSTAAGFVAAQEQAYYVEMRSVWSKKPFLLAVLKTMGIQPAGTVAAMADQISEELAASQRPLILDEFDYAVQKEGLIDLVRDIYEQSGAPIVLIGEEKLPQKLQRWERFHGRIMESAQAQPVDLDDARTLQQHYAADIHIEDDLLQRLVNEARGSVRRIVTNLDRIANLARLEGKPSINLKDWGGRPLHTGLPPKTRGF